MSEASTYQPHIVFIITDQQRYDTIAALGFPHVDTPHIDRLVNEGVTFEKCFINAPSCVPSRCSLFQGAYPHSTGVYKNGDTWTTSWVSDLADSGYRCVNVGKMHTVPYGARAGFHERYVVENKDRFLEGRYFFDEWDKALRARGLVKQQRELYRQRDDYGERMGSFTWDLPADMHSDTFVGGFARWWLQTYPVAQPLFLQVGFPGPHPPYDPTPEALADYIDRDIPIREYSPEEIAAQPGPMRALRQHMMEVDHDSIVHLESPTQSQRHYQRACYLANVTMIDTQIGQIMEALEEKGLLDDSVVIFTSDHGDSLGDHGHIQKWNMYEETVHVPAMMWFGESARRNLGAPAPGTRVSSLVSLLDVGATIRELAGLQLPGDGEAISLLPLMGMAAAGRERTNEGPRSGAAVAVSDALWEVPSRPLPFVAADGGREYVFAEHGRDNILDSTSVMTMVRDERWKLVAYADTDEGQLFDLATDPDERANLWEDPDAAGERRRMEGVLQRWYQDSLYRTRARRRR